MNFFSEHFDMKFILEELQKQYNERKHLLCDVNYNILMTQRKKEGGLSTYEENLLDKQKKIIMHMKNNYQKLNNINYIKYYLPYCVQPKTNNTDICVLKNGYQKNVKKKNILRELNLRKRLVEEKIDNFVKKYTGKIKRGNIMHKKMSQLYEEKSRIEIFIKSKRDNKIKFDHVIGDIAFFDCHTNVLLENAILVKNSVERRVPWIFIQSGNVLFFREKS
ncbi:hypothetical protein, conserved [Plasmodium gonderi]|uniref:LSM domain-containing protein n=1 Tax=Plasmodium gonderi TaxID=77519 RepID=A0A1Y1JJR4_PLAGO|nr:hypothetical protein, conserved [Plasmodium gonderi]GAW80274.1 hypothetical protein, conserved [Plasmodium gonderi]